MVEKASSRPGSAVLTWQVMATASSRSGASSTASGRAAACSPPFTAASPAVAGQRRFGSGRTDEGDRSIGPQIAKRGLQDRQAGDQLSGHRGRKAGYRKIPERPASLPGAEGKE